jgi:hypothetical protein
MPSAVLEPATPAAKQLKTYVFDRKATVIGELITYSLTKQSRREDAMHGNAQAC